ncbi:MAG: hypothetical protein DI539_07470 [Flavobacterium psychrophilum]|nr:MAG: hypothetical protein DI539_07470 [Flavobacterium psychrophilum]
MKRIMFKGLFSALILGLFWSCSTENDVQMQQGGVNQKDNDILSGVIAHDLGNGQYQFVVSQADLIKEIERISVAEGDEAEIQSVQVIDKELVNAPGQYIPVLIAGGVNATGTLVTYGFGLVKAGTYLSGGGAAIGEDRPPRISCTGCGTGCFLEWYKLDDKHSLGYCDSAGCGDYCFKNKLD